MQTLTALSADSKLDPWVKMFFLPRLLDASSLQPPGYVIRIFYNSEPEKWLETFLSNKY